MSYAVVTSDKHGTILSANQGAVKLFGFTQQEMVGGKINMLMAPPYREQHDTFMKNYQQRGESTIMGKSRIVTGINKQGESINLCLSLSEAETARGSLYIALFEQAPDNRVIIDTDKFGKIYGVKGNVFLTFGYHKEGLIGGNISKLCPPEIAAKHDEYMLAFDKREDKKTSIVGKVRNLQAIHKTKPEPFGISLLVKKAILRVRKEDGEIEEIPGFRGVITPVDDVQAIVTLSKNGRVISASSDFFLLFGYAEEEITGQSIAKLMKGNPKEIFSSKKASGIRKKIECIHKDRSIFTAEIVIRKGTSSNDDGEDVFVCKICRASAKKQDKDIISEGEHMGMYTYGKILGSGYFGKVRMAFHRITNEKVAIKTLRKKQYLSVNMEYPPREIAVLKALDHPRINRLYDTVVLPDRIHLILEFVEGRELCEIVETEPIPEDVCRHLWRQILTGIGYLHQNGIVHRDLKLENIIIDRRGNAKIIDLGFGNFILHENHLLRTFCGSPDYAAPELFLGKAYNGFQADCWSLGVLLYAMLSGMLPFKDSNCVMRGTFQFPDSITPKARDLISKILNKDPTSRITVAQMMEHPWTNQGCSGPPQQPRALGTTIHDDVIEEMRPLGMEPSTVKKSLELGEYNQFTTTYFLLLQRKLRLENEEARAQNTHSSGGKKKGNSDDHDCNLL